MMRKNLMVACDYVSQSEAITHHKKKRSMCMFLFLVIALSLVSLSVLATTTITMANAQTPSNSTSNTNITASNETGVKQMGICVVGAKSPCNGDRNSPT
jgi:hypothetical protein